MADVSRAGLPSSSSKHVYDGVFSSSKVNSTVFTSFNDDDYGEIFGCSKLDDGGWQSSCSIPVVELPVSEQRVRGVRGIEMDYGGVLGGLSDEGLSFMNGDELFDQLKKKARTSPPLVSVSRTRSREQAKEITGSRIPSHSQNVQPSMDGTSKSSNDVKQNKQKTNGIPSSETNGTRHVGCFKSTPGPTCTSHDHALLQEVQNIRTPVVKCDTQFDNDVPIGETHLRNSSSDLGPNKWKAELDSGFQKAPEVTNQMNGASHEVDSSHEAMISETPIIQADTEVEMDVNVVAKGKHSRHSSSDIGVNEHKTEFDTSFQKVRGLSGSNAGATRCTSQPCTVADEADAEFDVKINVGVDGFSNSGPNKQNYETHSASYQESGLKSSSPAAFDSGKNIRRHSRMTSLDLGRQASDHDDGGSHRKSRFGSSYSFDASHDPSVARVKVQPSKVIRSSSQPHFFPMESHYKISENSKSSSPLPSLDDQLDTNSLAAISASALQRAVEEAEMQIRLAKEFLEQEGGDCTKLRFKDTLKAKVIKENKHVNKINNAKKKKNVADHAHVDDVTISSSLGRESVLETARFVPAVKDHKQFLKESISGEKAEALEFIEEGGKNEVGEWEAKKHLNQLITGVKNRLASFMTWQVETEKKEESKEVESVKQPHSSEYGGREPKVSVENESVITSANKREIEENVTRVVPQHIESEESGPTRSNSAEQEKVGDLVESTLDTKGSTRTNFMIFSFNSRRLRGLSHSEEMEKKESQENSEIKTENKLENGANVEVQDNSVSQDYGERLINSIYEECMATVKEHYPMEAHDTNQFIHEEDNDRGVSQEANVQGKEEYTDDCAMDVGHRHDRVIYEEHGVDRVESNDGKEAGDGRLIEESEDNRSASVLEVVDEVNEECGSDTDASIHEADDDTRVNEECGDDTYTTFHEADDDTSVSEEYASIHEEGYDRSRSSDEAENFKLTEEHGEESVDNARLPEDIVHIVEDDNDKNEIKVFEESEDQPDDAQLLEKVERESEKRSESPISEKDQCEKYYIEEVSGQINDVEEDSDYQNNADHVETTKKDVEQASCMEVADECWKIEEAVLSKAEEAVRRIDGGDVGAETEFAVENGKIMENNDFPSDVEMGVETPASHDEQSEKKMEITNHSSKPEIVADIPVLSHTVIDWAEEKRGLMPVFAEISVKVDGFEHHNSIDSECDNPLLPEFETNGPKDVADGEETENVAEFNGIKHHNNLDAAFPCENSLPDECDTDVKCGQKDVNDGEETELKSEAILVNQNKHLHEPGETSDTWVGASVSDQEGEKCNVEGVHRRRRWFENGETVGAVERPIILEEADLSGTVEFHADKVDSDTPDTVREADSVLDHGDGLVNVETTHKRRRWFVKTGEEGFPEPPSLFEGIKVTSHLDHEVANGSVPSHKPDECVSESNFEADDVVAEENDKPNVEATPRRKRWFESVENVEPTRNLSHEDDKSGTEKCRNLDNVSTVEEKNDVPNKVEPMNEPQRDTDEESRRRKEREKERIAVERAIREARERAFAEAKERAKREAAERPPSRVSSQKSVSGGLDRPGKVSSEANSSSDKASMEAKIRAERAAVERATAEVRERALQKALSEKQRSREQGGRYPPERSSSLDPKYSSSSYSRPSDPSNNDKFDGVDGESEQRRKARLERQNRTMERAAKALEEKNKRDLLVQKEQAARNILADALDAEVKRWSTGKEGNVRALLSTLQYILGSDSGWQAVSLTDLVAPTAVRKAYKKATLCVHPDKLQQRGATIQQKYICEKVFDLLKDAWSRFNPEER